MADEVELASTHLSRQSDSKRCMRELAREARDEIRRSKDAQREPAPVEKTPAPVQPALA